MIKKQIITLAFQSEEPWAGGYRGRMWSMGSIPVCPKWFSLSSGWRWKDKTKNLPTKGSGCGSVGRVVASDTRDPGFETSYRQTCTEKTKIKKNRPEMAIFRHFRGLFKEYTTGLFYSFFTSYLTVNRFNCWWLDSNLDSLVLEATSVPQPLHLI